MRFVFAFAGIPSSVYDEVHKRLPTLCGDSAKFICRPFRSRAANRYIDADVDYFVNGFYEVFANDFQNALTDTGFAIFYIDHNESSALIRDAFFPALLSVPINWQPASVAQPTLERQAKNKLLNMLRDAVRQAKETLPSIRKEFSERDSKTPLLLPIRNFRSHHLVPELQQLEQSIYIAKNKQVAIRMSVDALERIHPPRPHRDRYREYTYFVDDHNVEFRPPGRDRHAFAQWQGDADHKRCLLAGRCRLGAPYDRAFHYDCTRGRTKLSGSFFACHGPESPKVGDPHINIAPNDFTRC